MKPIYLDLSGARALGDAICSTPTIKKLYDSYGQKINVFSQYPELFRKNPYVDKNFHSKDIQVDYVKENFIYHNSFHNIGQKNQWDVEMKHNNMDIRQFHAIMLGFMLSPNEMTCEYYPETFEPIDGLPEKYVLIHPVQTWPSRTWLAENWMKLTKLLNDRGISVVSIGKDSSEIGFFNVDKPIFNFEIHDGLNLMNNTSISQAWHLINKSIAFVTMDSGLLHLAGTTDSEIIMLGSSLKPEFRLPYRNGSQIYKQYYVSGGCQLACGSNMKHGVKEWGDIQGIPPLIGCLENKHSFECHPRVETVLHKIENIIENVR
jgi:ADP-heptose:LPS heptosyltransferase